MKKNKKILLLGIGILLLLSVIVGISFAYFYVNDNQDNNNVAQSACFNITYTDRNDINLVNTIPLSDEAGSKLTPYEFTITNTCNLAATYYVNIEKLSDSTLDELYLKYKLDNNSPAILGQIEDNETLVNENAVSSRTIESAILLGGESRTYNLRLWVDENTTKEQSAEKFYSSKVVVTATLNKNPYVQIALNANDGTINSNSISFVNGRFMSTLPTPTKKGYIFLGWYTTPTFDEGTGVGVDTPASASITNLYAKYTKDTFTLSIDPDGGEYNNSPGVYETNVTYKNVYVIDGTIEKEGYTFTNWSLESGNETTLVGNTVTMGSEDSLVKANYNINSYKLTVDPNGGTWDNYTTSQEYNMDYHTTKNIPNPTKEGYTFTGWSITSGNLSDTTFTIGASDAVLTANWQVNDFKWIVYHNKMNVDGNGYTLADSEAGHGVRGTSFQGTLQNYTGFTNPTRTSKTIGEDVAFNEEGTPVNNVLDYNYSRNKYSVTVNPNGGTYSSSTSNTTHSNIYYQGTYTINNPTRTGYNFSGWTLSGSNSSISGTTFTMGLEDSTLTAGWTVKTTTVTLNKQSGSGGTDSVTATYGSAMPNATKPTRYGYTFGGYYTGTNGSGTQYYNASMQSVKNWDKEDASITLYAKWTGNSYTVTLEKMGGSGGTSSVSAVYGSAMPSATKPTKTSCDFGGYYNSPGGSGTQYYNASMGSVSNWNQTNETTIYAKWTYSGGAKYVYGANGWEAHYDSSGNMDACYWTGKADGTGAGTYKNGTGTKCDGGSSGSSYAHSLCKNGTGRIDAYHKCSTSISDNYVKGGGLNASIC